jgi:hypothetical protein
MADQTSKMLPWQYTCRLPTMLKSWTYSLYSWILWMDSIHCVQSRKILEMVLLWTRGMALTSRRMLMGGLLQSNIPSCAVIMFQNVSKAISIQNRATSQLKASINSLYRSQLSGNWRCRPGTWWSENDSRSISAVAIRWLVGSSVSWLYWQWNSGHQGPFTRYCKGHQQWLLQTRWHGYISHGHLGSNDECQCCAQACGQTECLHKWTSGYCRHFKVYVKFMTSTLALLLLDLMDNKYWLTHWVIGRWNQIELTSICYMISDRRQRG